MKNFYTEDTITALSTPYGLGGIAIIRISGKNSVKIAEKLYKSPNGKSKKITSYNLPSIYHNIYTSLSKIEKIHKNML